MELYEINQLRCAYNGGPVVLEVEELTIPKGKLIVIVGLSGAGKSTFLETLGLMNNTIHNGSSVFFKPNETENYPLGQLWKQSNEKLLSEVRRKHLSFIFQSTNLMPNFTVYENICLTQMLQGKSRSEAVVMAKDFMKKMGLEEIDQFKSSFEISGGQAQRVAFVRAITPAFSVLFGDEPTGNLDEKNSRELMGVLKNSVVKDGKTAIIVSHNLELALGFADQIILITKPNSHGVIHPGNVYNRTADEQMIWSNGVQTYENADMHEYLKKILD